MKFQIFYNRYTAVFSKVCQANWLTREYKKKPNGSTLSAGWVPGQPYWTRNCGFRDYTHLILLLHPLSPQPGCRTIRGVIWVKHIPGAKWPTVLCIQYFALVLFPLSLHSLYLAVEVNKKLAAELDTKGTHTQRAGQGPFHKKKRLCLYKILQFFFLKYSALLYTL